VRVPSPAPRVDSAERPLEPWNDPASARVESRDQHQRESGSFLRRGRRGGPRGGVVLRFSGALFGERYQSGQLGRAVNPLAHAFGGSNPPLSTRDLHKGVSSGNSSVG